VTGIINAIVGVLYQGSLDESGESQEEYYFEMCQEIGVNLGKFLRLSLDFDDFEDEY